MNVDTTTNIIDEIIEEAIFAGAQRNGEWTEVVRAEGTYSVRQNADGTWCILRHADEDDEGIAPAARIL